MIYVYLLLVVICFCFAKNKFPIGNILAFVFLIYLTSISTNIPDFQNYSYIYEHITPYETFGMGKGWYFLNNLGRINNLSYVQFRTILISISLILITITLKYFSGKSSNLFWGMYLLYPVFLDLVQVRFFFATSISIFALIFLRKRKIWSIFIFLILSLIAIRIHSSNAFYLLFATVPIVNKINKKYILWPILILTLILIPLRGSLQNFVTIFASERQTYYFYNNSSIGIVLLFDLMIIIFYIITFQFNNYIKINSEFNNREKNIGDFAEDINLIMLFLIPLSFVSSEFLRVQRVSWIVVYILICIIYSRTNSVKIFNIKVSAKWIGLLLAIFGLILLVFPLSPEAFLDFFN